MICTGQQKRFDRNSEIIEVQTFGDRINVVVKQGVEASWVKQLLESVEMQVRSARTIQPSLENVFIALLREQTPPEAENNSKAEKVSAHA